MVLRTSGAVVLHVPKTGGTWVDNALSAQDRVTARISPKHIDAVRLRSYPYRHPYLALRKVASRGPLWLWDAMHAPTIVFLRDPVDWYTSRWHYMERTGWRDWRRRNRIGRMDWHPLAALLGHPPDDLDPYIKSFVTSRPGYLTEVYRRYTTGAAFVGWQSNLASDLASALEVVGEPWDPRAVDSVPPANTSRTAGSRTLSAEIAELVRRCEVGISDPTS